MDRTAKTLAILLTLSSLSLAGELRACYRAYIAFLPVAETCIEYRQEGNLLRINSLVRTISVGKIVKRVYNRGGAIVELPEMNPRHFFYHQEEGEFKRYQEYRFENNKIKALQIHYVKLSEEVEKREEKEYEYRGFVDPYTAGLILYRDSTKIQQGTIKMFYDDREYLLPYSVKGKEEVKTPAGSFSTRKIEVHPNIETKGLLKPEGPWYLWVDEETNIPVRMELKFKIGSTTARLERVEGNKKFITGLIKN